MSLFLVAAAVAVASVAAQTGCASGSCAQCISNKGRMDALNFILTQSSTPGRACSDFMWAGQHWCSGGVSPEGLADCMSLQCADCARFYPPTAQPTPRPTPRPTPTPTRSPTPSPTPAPTPRPTPQPTPRPTPFPTPSTPFPTPFTTPSTAPTTIATEMAPISTLSVGSELSSSAESPRVDDSSSDEVVVVNNEDSTTGAFPSEAWIGVAAGIALIVAALAVMIVCVIRKRSESHPRPARRPVYSSVQHKSSLVMPHMPKPNSQFQFPGGADTLPLPGGYGWGTMEAEGAGATIPGYRSPGFDVPDTQSHIYSELSLRPGQPGYSSEPESVPTAARIYLTSTPPSSGVSTAVDREAAGAGVPLYGDVPAQTNMVSYVNRYANEELLQHRNRK